VIVCLNMIVDADPDLLAFGIYIGAGRKGF
jgi:hypothetical protein